MPFFFFFSVNRPNIEVIFVTNGLGGITGVHTTLLGTIGETPRAGRKTSASNINEMILEGLQSRWYKQNEVWGERRA